MKVIAYMWAKESSSELVLGKPVLWWCLTEAKRAEFIDEVFVWTETKALEEIAVACGCRAISRKPEDTSYFEEHVHPDAWLVNIQEQVLSQTGTLGDVKVLLNCNSCMMTCDILEDMFVKLMEDMVADTIVPVCKVDPLLYMVNPNNGRLFPVWAQSGLDRQHYPDLFRAGALQITHTLRRRGQRLLHLEVDSEFLHEVCDSETADLAEYYLTLRKGGKIVLPRMNDSVK